MQWYPDRPDARHKQIARDLVVLAVLVLLGCLALLVRDAVLLLTAISSGFTDGAVGVRDAWTSVGDALSGVPIVGDDLQNSVQGLSDATAGNAVAAGDAITDAITRAANTLAAVIFVLPAALLLAFWLPARLARASTWAAASNLLRPADGAPPPADLLALRALCRLPLPDLARCTDDPFAAYRAGRFDELVATLYEHEGVAGPVR